MRHDSILCYETKAKKKSVSFIQCRVTLWLYELECEEERVVSVQMDNCEMVYHMPFLKLL